MAVELTIDGVVYEPKINSMRISQTANGHTTASFKLLSENAAYRPPINGQVFWEEDGFKLFGGLIERPRERSFILGTDYLETDVSCTDFNGYAARRIVTETIPSGTMAAALNVLVPKYLGVFGVTIHPSQVPGPLLPILEYKNETLLNVLNQIMTLTGETGIPFSWRIDYNEVFRAYQPGTFVAPFDASDANDDKLDGDVEVEEARNNNYANRVIIEVAPQADAGHVETFQGDDVSTVYPMQWKIVQGYGIIHVYELDGVTPAGGETFGRKDVDFDAEGNPTQWWWDPETNLITRNIGPTDSTKIYSLTFSGTYEATATAETAEAATDPWEILIRIDEIPDDTTLQALADAHLAKSSIIIKTATYKTYEQGLEVGQEQLVNIARRNINALGVITSITFSDVYLEGEMRVLKTVEVTIDPSLTNLDRGWRDVYRIWAGDKMGAGATGSLSANPAPVSGGPSPPLQSVQINKANKFFGKESFSFYDVWNSVVCGGGGSSITATQPESCQVFGYNCHIADP